MGQKQVDADLIAFGRAAIGCALTAVLTTIALVVLALAQAWRLLHGL